MWKMFMFAIVWKSVTATLQSSGFSKNRESSVKEFLCFGTHENLSSPLDNDNAWNTLVWQLGTFWVGMDICLHNYLIKEKERKREKHFNMKILHCHIPQFFSSLDTAVLPTHCLGKCWHPTTQGNKNLLPHNFCLQQQVLQWSICPDSQLKWCVLFLRPVKSRGSALDRAAFGPWKVAYSHFMIQLCPSRNTAHGSLALSSCVQIIGISRSQINVNKWLYIAPLPPVWNI